MRVGIDRHGALVIQAENEDDVTSLQNWREMNATYTIRLYYDKQKVEGEVCVGKNTGQFFECGNLMAEIYNEPWKVEFMEFLRSKGVDVREIG